MKTLNNSYQAIPTIRSSNTFPTISSLNLNSCAHLPLSSSSLPLSCAVVLFYWNLPSLLKSIHSQHQPEVSTANRPMSHFRSHSYFMESTKWWNLLFPEDLWANCRFLYFQHCMHRHILDPFMHKWGCVYIKTSFVLPDFIQLVKSWFWTLITIKWCWSDFFLLQNTGIPFMFLTVNYIWHLKIKLP